MSKFAETGKAFNQAAQQRYETKSRLNQGEAKMTTEATATPVVRTSAGLRDMLFDELDALRAGSSTPTIANAKARIASGIVETVRMELEVQQFVQKTKATDNSPLGSPLSLGVSK